MNKVSWSIFFSTAMLLNGCTKYVSHHDVIRSNISDSISNSIETNILKAKGNEDKLPDKINDLMKVSFGGSLGLKRENVVPEPKFDIVVNEVEAKDFFFGLIKDTNYNVIVDKSVQGLISLNMNNVTVRQVLNAVRDSYGYEYKLTDYGYYIYGQKLISKVYQVNYINLSRRGSTTIGGINTTQVSSKGSVDGSNGGDELAVDQSVATIQQEQPFWGALEANLQAIVGVNKKDKSNVNTEKAVIVNANTNTVVVRAYPLEQRLVEEYLKEVEEILQRQVVIEAKIVEVKLNNQFKTGIRWGGSFDDGKIQFGKLNSSVLGSVLSSGTGIGMFKGTFGGFDASLDLLNAYGSVNVLSNPRVTTLNNQKAVIKIGTEDYYVIGLQDSTISGGSALENRSNIELKIFFSGISLDVIPQIDKDDNIILHIHPAICEVSPSELKLKQSGKDTVVPTASNRIKESDSIVRAKSGEVIVIGGLMETYSKVYKDGIPVVDQIPLIGEAAKNRDQAAQKFEMVILLKPTIIKKTEDWNKELTVVSERVKKLNKERFTYDFEHQEKLAKQQREAAQKNQFKKQS